MINSYLKISMVKKSIKSIIFATAILLILIVLSTCKTEPVDYTALDTFSKHQQVRWNKTLTDVMVADIFTPPVCSRIYLYPNLAAYEVLATQDAAHKSFAGTLTGLTAIPQPDRNKEYYLPLSSMIAFATAAKPLVYAMEKIETAEMEYLKVVKAKGIPQEVYDNSIAYGQAVGQHIAPDYMPAIEPHWNTIRTLVMNSADQFSTNAPTNYSTKEQSDFYKGAIQVLETVNGLDEEQTAIAKFWDCNPNISHTKGHLMFYDQKISPGGHWISIAGIAIKKKNTSDIEAAKVLALTSITLSDAFISCWDEKYRSSLIRPETYINEYIDKDWKPLLQTPAFPEHTSGHSVISTAAAVMLTSLLGDNFDFVNSTEVDYGLPIRNFSSFYQASEEAAISRLYGGIHYMPAIENGVSQGKAIGNFIVEKLRDYK